MYVTNDSIGWLGWDRIYSALEIEEVYLLSHPPQTCLFHSLILSLFHFLPLYHSISTSHSLLDCISHTFSHPLSLSHSKKKRQ